MHIKSYIILTMLLWKNHLVDVLLYLEMRCLKLFLLYIWISGCNSARLCLNNCKCEGGTSLNSNLDCSGKGLMYFPQFVEKLRLLVGQIILKNNNIEHLPHGEAGIGLKPWPAVWTIDISGNKIITVKDNVFQHRFPRLKILDLSRNQITQIQHKAFVGVNLLTVLYLNRNQISFIPKDAFDRLKNLYNLDLANNLLKMLDFRWFKNLNSLTYLYLEANRIETVESWIYSWPSSLKKVSLNDNRIQIALPIPKYVEYFNLDGNPTNCGCKPHMFSLNAIPNMTLCKVRMQCNSIKLEGDCKSEQLFEDVLNFFKDLAAKPICQAPIVTFVRNHDRLPSLICVVTGVPAPNITLYSSETGQKLRVNGVEKSNFTSVVMNQLYSGIYHCNASNIVGGMTKNLLVDICKFQMSDYCKSTDSKLTSEVPDVLTEISVKSRKSKLQV